MKLVQNPRQKAQRNATPTQELSQMLGQRRFSEFLLLFSSVSVAFANRFPVQTLIVSGKV